MAGRIGSALASGPAVACTKTLLTVFNFIFWISGIAVLAVGIWTKIQLHIYMELSTVYFKEAPYIFIGVGAGIVLVGSFGCCCTFKGNSILLYLFVGLGNHDLQTTRHSVGMQVVDKMAEYLNVSLSKNKSCSGCVGIANINNIEYSIELRWTVSSNDYELDAQFFDVPTQNIYLMYDDIDRELGKLCLKEKGSANGHNGVRSVMNSLRTEVRCFEEYKTVCWEWIVDCITMYQVLDTKEYMNGKSIEDQDYVPEESFAEALLECNTCDDFSSKDPDFIPRESLSATESMSGCDTGDEDWIPKDFVESETESSETGSTDEDRAPEMDREDQAQETGNVKDKSEGFQGKEKEKTRRVALKVRHHWTMEEKSALKRQFMQAIAQETTPGQLACINAIRREPCLANFQWRQVKFAVKNLITTYRRQAQKGF